MESQAYGRCCVKAVLAMDKSKKESPADRRINALYDAINRLDSPDFFIGIEIRRAPNENPPARRMRSLLRQRLSTADWDELTRLVSSEGPERLPSWCYEHEGWKVDFSPIPKSAGLRGQTGVRPIGMVFERGGWIDSRRALLNAMESKARAYDDLGMPYVIAVNACATFVQQTDILV